MTFRLAHLILTHLPMTQHTEPPAGGRSEPVLNCAASASSQPAALSRHIVLIGPMCSGKSAAARSFAELLGCAWTDLDDEFVTEHGPIPAYIEQHGMDAFRVAESVIFARALARKKPQIIATGGGVVLAAKNRELLQDQVTFWLAVSPHVALSRMRGGTGRPLLAGDDPFARWQAIRTEREPLYRECGIGPIDTSTMRPGEVAQTLQGMLDAASSTHSVSTRNP